MMMMGVCKLLLSNQCGPECVSVLYGVPFLRYSASNNGLTLKSGFGSLSVIENGTIRKIWYGFLFAFHSNYGRIFSRVDTIHERDSQPARQTDTPHDSKGSRGKSGWTSFTRDA